MVFRSIRLIRLFHRNSWKKCNKFWKRFLLIGHTKHWWNGSKWQTDFEMSERCNISPGFSMKFFGRCNILRTLGFYNDLISKSEETTQWNCPRHWFWIWCCWSSRICNKQRKDWILWAFYRRSTWKSITAQSRTLPTTSGDCRCAGDADRWASGFHICLQKNEHCHFCRKADRQKTLSN